MEKNKFTQTFKDKLSRFYDINEKVPSKIDPEEANIVDHILGGNVGCKFDAAEWISTFLENEKGYGKLLDMRWSVVIPSGDSTAEPQFFPSNQKKWFFLMNEKKDGREG